MDRKSSRVQVWAEVRAGQVERLLHRANCLVRWRSGGCIRRWLASAFSLTIHYSLRYPLSTHHSPLTTYYSPLATHHSPLPLLTSRYSLLATRYTTHYSLLIVHFSCIPRSKSWEWRYVLPRACHTDPQRDRTGTQIQYGSWCHPCQV